MKRITKSGASKLGTPELYGPPREAFIAFSAAPRNTQDQRDALATMRAVKSELTHRAPTP